MGRGDCGVFISDRSRSHLGALPSTLNPLVSMHEEAKNDLAGEGGAVLVRLNTGDRKLSLQECVCVGTQTQLISLYDLGVLP